MLARIRKSAENKDSGFTLIELLVVMIIIGILAAIAIPAFLNQKKKARDTSAKADVTTIGKEIAAYYVDGTASGTVTVNASGLWSINPTSETPITGKLSTGNSASGTLTNSSAWCVQVVPSEGSKTFSFSAENGLKSNACSGATN